MTGGAEDRQQAWETFPSVQLASQSGGLPVEVALIAQLGIGAGDQLVSRASARQRRHAAFVDALDEPSARLGGLDLQKGDSTALYTFTVDDRGHPFHRHAGHRVFTAISGSAGALLRFSTVSDEQLARDPDAFVRALRHVTIPPDCLFTLRFGGGTWHQFLPLRLQAGHPALFALSCHTNELGGELPAELRATVAGNEAGIADLTEVLPIQIQQRVQALEPASVATVALSLDAAPASLAARFCASTRRAAGLVRRLASGWRPTVGFLVHSRGRRVVTPMEDLPVGSLLETQLGGAAAYEDCVATTLDVSGRGPTNAQTLLAQVLEGFLDNRPAGVTRLMALRNLLVRPWRLRTSPLGCPVSSLLSAHAPVAFAGRFPVFAQQLDRAGKRAQVILGADDRHLRFRSCVDVEIGDDGTASIRLATRVQPLNAFGRTYMAAIARTHRGYVAPVMLRMAVDHATDAVAPRSPRSTHYVLS